MTMIWNVIYASIPSVVLDILSGKNDHACDGGLGVLLNSLLGIKLCYISGGYNVTHLSDNLLILHFL